MPIGTLYDSSGREVSPESRITYSASATFTPPATPTDMVIIEGSASKIIRVHSFVIATNNMAAGSQEFLLIKRSTADTGGTFVTATPVPHDSGNPASTVNRVGHFTVNPATLGTGVGTVVIKRVASPVLVPATFAGVVSDAGIDLLDKIQSLPLIQHIVLRGAAQCLALYFGGAALVAGQVHAYNIVWDEGER